MKFHTIVLALLLSFFAQAYTPVTITKVFTSRTAGDTLFVRNHDKFSYALSGTFSATVTLEYTTDGGSTWKPIGNFTGPATGFYVLESVNGAPAYARFRTDSYVSGTATTTITEENAPVPLSQELLNSFGQAVAAVTERGMSMGELEVNGDSTIENLTVTGNISLPIGAGTGITTFNGLTDSTQTLAIGTSGLSPAWSSSTPVHTLNIPMASTSSVTAGLLSKAEYDVLSAKQTATLSNGKILAGNGSNVATAVTPSGGVTMSNAGVFTLANPSSSTLGGVQSAAAVSHQWINSISTSGVPALSQPAFSDLSGSVASTQMPALTGDVTSSAGTVSTSISNATVVGKLLTGYSSTTGSLSSSDSIVSAISKLNGNLAAAGGGTPGGSTTHLQYNNAGAFGGDTSTTDGSGNLISTSLTAPTLTTISTGSTAFASAGVAFGSGGIFVGHDSAVAGQGMYAAGSGVWPGITMRHSRGTIASPLSSQSNDLNGVLEWSSYTEDDHTFKPIARIYGFTSSSHATSGELWLYALGSVNSQSPFHATDTFRADSTVSFPNLATSSSATTGTLCWTTGGNVNVDTTVACLASTEKVKQDIEDLNIGLKEVMEMRPVSYQRKAEFNPQHNGREVGLIAEEVQKIDERLVAADDKGEVFGVRYMQLTAVLTKAIQEQQTEILDLQKEIKELTNEHSQ